MNPYVLAGAMVALFLAGLGGFKLGKDHILAQQVETVQLIAAVEERAQVGAAAAIAKNKPVNRYNTQVVEHEVRTVVDYSKCMHSDDGLRAVNGALENKRAEPVSGGVVPDADTVNR